MNAPFSPSPDPDELASALVDGLLTTEEADRARQDPAVNRRVEEIRRVRTQLRATPPPPPGHAAQAVAAALSQYDPNVRPLRPALPPARQPRAARWLAVAAAILAVVLVAAVGLTSLGDDSRNDEAATMESGADQESSETSGGGDSGAAAEAPSANDEDSARDAPTSAEASTLPGGVAQLGSFETVEDLTQSVTTARTGFTDDGAAGVDQVLPPVPQSSSTCPAASIEGDPDEGIVTFVGQGTLRNVAVVVHVYQTDSGDEQLVATTADCLDVVDEPYQG